MTNTCNPSIGVQGKCSYLKLEPGLHRKILSQNARKRLSITLEKKSFSLNLED